jgi:hypothetical protein
LKIATWLDKRDTEAMGGTPRNVTMMDHVLAGDQKVERLGYAKRAFDLETGACLREIAHHAADAAGTIEFDRTRLQYAVPRAAPALRHRHLIAQA